MKNWGKDWFTAPLGGQPLKILGAWLFVVAIVVVALLIGRACR